VAMKLHPSSRIRLSGALMGCILLAACGGGGGVPAAPPTAPAPVPAPAPAPAPAPTGVLTGNAAAAALGVIGNVALVPAPEEDFDEAGYLLSRITVLFKSTATVAEVNAAAAAVGATGIASARSGSLLMVLSLPRQADVAALETLLDRLEAQPGVAGASWDRVPSVDVLPGEGTGSPLSREFLHHLMPTRFPAAWNAGGLLAGTNCTQPLTIIVPDKYGRTDPASFVNQLPAATWVPDDARRPGVLGKVSDHGYEAVLTLAARHDAVAATGALPTGAFPGADCVRIEAMNAANLSMVELVEIMAARLNALDRNVVLNFSMGYGTFLCDADELLLPERVACEKTLRGLTQARLERELKHRILSSLAWARAGVTPTTQRHVLFVQAAGNEASDALSILYPGFAESRLGAFSTLATLLPDVLALNLFDGGPGTTAATLWTPRPEAARVSGFAPPEGLERVRVPENLLLETVAELQRQGRVAELREARNSVVVVGALSQATDVTGFTDALGLSASLFSNFGPDLYAVGEDVRLAPGLTVGINGTSFTAPQVAGLAAYLWLLSPELRTAPVAQTRRHLLANSQRGAPLLDAPVVDAYAAVLSLDRLNPARPVRSALLDLNGDGRFDDIDIQRFLQAFDAADPLAEPTFARADLNGDGRLGGAGAVAMHLDGATFGADGAPVLFDGTEFLVEGQPVNVNERRLTDLQVLCYFAYEGLLYSGTEAARRALLGIDRCGVPLSFETLFPEQIAGAGPLEVTVRRPDAQGDLQVVSGQLLRFVASCGEVRPQQAVTSDAGRANVTVDVQGSCPGATTVSVAIEAIRAVDGDTPVVLGSTAVSAALAPQGNFGTVTYQGSTLTTLSGGQPVSRVCELRTLRVFFRGTSFDVEPVAPEGSSSNCSLTTVQRGTLIRIQSDGTFDETQRGPGISEGSLQRWAGSITPAQLTLRYEQGRAIPGTFTMDPARVTFRIDFSGAAN